MADIITAIIIILVFVLGFILGRLYELRKQHPSGTLRIDHSDPEQTCIFLEITRADDLTSKKRIYLNVSHESYISQE